MSKHTISGWIIWEKWKDSSNDTAVFKFSPYEPTGRSDIWDQVAVREHSFEIEIPESFNPVPVQVAMLEEEKRRARLELGARLAKIDEQISKLTCLTNDVTEAACAPATSHPTTSTDSFTCTLSARRKHALHSLKTTGHPARLWKTWRSCSASSAAAWRLLWPSCFGRYSHDPRTGFPLGIPIPTRCRPLAASVSRAGLAPCI